MVYQKCLLFLVSVPLFFSCVQSRKLFILQSPTDKVEVVKNDNQPYYINEGDILNIRVTSAEAASLDIFNRSIGEDKAAVGKGSDIFINGYIVDDSGNVDMPIVGKVKVNGLTMQQCKDSLAARLSMYYKIFSVNVELMNYNVTVLGEVTKPATFTVYSNQTNLLQVLGMAGGLTDFANNKKIHILRKEGKDSTSVHYVSIHELDILKSPEYYVKPNDVVYVEPLRIKVLKINTTTVQIFLSLTTIILLIINITRN